MLWICQRLCQLGLSLGYPFVNPGSCSDLNETPCFVLSVGLEQMTAQQPLLKLQGCLCQSPARTPHIWRRLNTKEMWMFQAAASRISCLSWNENDQKVIWGISIAQRRKKNEKKTQHFKNHLSKPLVRKLEMLLRSINWRLMPRL